jgi:hypothetical protein
VPELDVGGIAPLSMNKRTILIVVGGLLVVACSALIGMTLVLAWFPFYKSFAGIMEFIFHPVPLSLCLGLGLLFWGLSIPKKPSR